MGLLPGPLVSSVWLQENAHSPTLVVCDVRWYLDGRSGEAAYEAGHIPGAVWIDVDHELAGNRGTGPGRHPLPTPEHFAACLAAKGIGNDSVVVAYDDAGGSIAARLWWMLSSIGHNIAVLDGGISAWTGELSTDSPSLASNAVFTPKAWPTERFVDAIVVDEARRSTEIAILDARPRSRYNGETNPTDRRPGHLPGAISSPWSENLEPLSGLFRNSEELRGHFTALGVSEDQPVISHCGSGITACHNLLALHLAEFGPGKLYPGSWSDWEADPMRPVETLLDVANGTE